MEAKGSHAALLSAAVDAGKASDASAARARKWRGDDGTSTQKGSQVAMAAVGGSRRVSAARLAGVAQRQEAEHAGMQRKKVEKAAAAVAARSPSSSTKQAAAAAAAAVARRRRSKRGSPAKRGKWLENLREPDPADPVGVALGNKKPTPKLTWKQEGGEDGEWTVKARRRKMLLERAGGGGTERGSADEAATLARGEAQYVPTHLPSVFFSRGGAPAPQQQQQQQQQQKKKKKQQHSEEYAAAVSSNEFERRRRQAALGASPGRGTTHQRREQQQQ